MTDLTPKTFAVWCEELLTKLRSNISGLSTGKASDARLRAEAFASILEGQSKYIDWSINQRFPNTANTAHLVRWALVYGITRKVPTISDGQVWVTGTPFAAVPINTPFVDAEGQQGKTSEAETISGLGFVGVDAVSVDTGVSVNWAQGELFTFSAPPVGVDEDLYALVDFTGGTDQETPAALLARLLDRIQNPPAGGTESDWRQWAESVDGVVAAFTHPERRGTGTIDVAIVTEGVDGHLALPGASLITSVEDKLDEERPVTTLDHEVVTPDAKIQAVTINDLVADEGIDVATLDDPIELAILNYYDTLETGVSLIWADLHTAINSVDGVGNFTLAVPAGDVTATLDSSTAELIMPGVITVNAST